MIALGGEVRVDDPDATLTRFDAIADEGGCAIQAFNARYLAGGEHLKRAVANANRAVDRGEAIARNRGVEILLYAAGRRQIEEALEMGITLGQGPIVVVVDEGPPDHGGWVGGPTPAERDVAEALRSAWDLDVDAVNRGDPACITSFFEISDRERSATRADLEALVIERVALLEVKK